MGQENQESHSIPPTGVFYLPGSAGYRQMKILDELKIKARERGLWNFWLTDSEKGYGLTTVEYAYLAEEMGKVSIAAEVFNCNAPDTGNMEVLERYGTSEHKNRWLYDLLDGKIRSAYVMTEPNTASSDAAQLTFSAVKDGESWVLNGEKWWISGAGDPRCKLYILLACTDPSAPKHNRHTMFVLDPKTPGIEVLRPIPAVAWIPLAILIWPTEESSIIFITFLGAFFPIVLNTVQGVEATPEILVRAARSLGATNVEIFWHVVFPAALPSIASGLAIGMGVSWFSLLAGEIISGQYGIGYFTWNAYSLIKYTDIVVGMLIIGGLGTFSTYLIRLLTRPMMRWQALEAGR